MRILENREEKKKLLSHFSKEIAELYLCTTMIEEEWDDRLEEHCQN